MPELPEVETLVRALRPEVEGRRITGVTVHDARVLETTPVRFRRLVSGRTIERVWRRGKWILLALDGGNHLMIQLRMTGQVLLVRPAENTHLRLEIRLNQGAFWYNDTRCLGRVTILTPQELEQRLSAQHQGPEALDITPAQLRRQLAGTSRAIKPTLLDQRIVSGIGNMYADEILHLAGLHPQLPSSDLAVNQLTALHRAIRGVLRAAIKLGGSTLRDGRYRDAQGAPGYFQTKHLVYGQEGRPCKRCATPVARKRIPGLIGRSSYFCPSCQPAP